MRDLEHLKRPAVFYGAETKKGLNIVLELLAFIGVYIVVNIAQAIVLGIGSVVLIFSNQDMIQSLINKDMLEYQMSIQQMASSWPVTLMSLFATIMTILVTVIFCRSIQKRKITSLGFRRKDAFREYIIGATVGFIIFSAAVLFCVMTGSLQIIGLQKGSMAIVVFIFLIAFLIQGLSEEVLLRGYLMVSINRRYPLIVAVIVNSIVFAALHLNNSGISVLAFINLALFGAFASIYFIKRGSIWGIAAVHGVWNFVQGNFYGIKVSGMAINQSIFESSSTSGMSLLNGGSFGLEGGLGVTIVLLIGITILWFMKGNIDEDEIAAEKQAAEQIRLEEERKYQYPPYYNNQAGPNYYNGPQSQYNPQQGQYNQPQGQYNPQQGQYNPQGGQYNPQGGQYNPQQGQYNPQQGQYNPQQGQYNPQQGQYNSQQGKKNPYEDDVYDPYNHQLDR